ncbi:MAG: tetratricopeptide repeat protein [Myxococcota bacterium]
MTLFWLVAAARGEVPPPDYRDALMEAAAAQVAVLARDEGLGAARAFAQGWERTVGEDARVAYEVGLAARLGGEPRLARSELDRALELDPTLVTARYDRGEMRLTEGDLPGAAADFEAVVAARPDHWAGHFRLADLAARARDVERFEAHLLDALRNGFAVRDVAGDPRWHDYLADPELGPVLRRLVVVYQDEAVLEALEKPVETP